MAWVIWVVIGLLLLILEVFTPGFILGCLGLGCLITGMFTLSGAGAIAQGITFCIGTLAVFFGIRPIYLKLIHRNAMEIRTNVDALIGRTGIVTRTIPGSQAGGRVKVGGEDWRAVPAEDIRIAAESRIEVLAVEGTTLVVRPVSSGKE